MVARQIRAYDGSGNPVFYYKDVGDTADGTGTNPDQSAVILRPGGALGQTTATPDKDGNILATLHYISNNLNSSIKSSNIALTTISSIGTSLTTLATIVCADFQALAIKLYNSGSTNLNALEVHGFEAADFAFDYQQLAASSGSYTTNNGKQSGNSLIPIVDSSGTLPSLPATQKAGILINCKYFQKIRLQASVASGTTNIQIAGTLMS